MCYSLHRPEDTGSSSRPLLIFESYPLKSVRILVKTLLQKALGISPSSPTLPRLQKAFFLFCFTLRTNYHAVPNFLISKRPRSLLEYLEHPLVTTALRTISKNKTYTEVPRIDPPPMQPCVGSSLCERKSFVVLYNSLRRVRDMWAL